MSRRSNTYLRRGKGLSLSMSAMPLEPFATKRPNVSFQIAIEAQAMASGRCA
ncbi:MAG: hypothetical protein LBR61_09740 [Synergistaceae bacterium]|nr:hypothetical protein [Synergistaceae bacterium]